MNQEESLSVVQYKLQLIIKEMRCLHSMEAKVNNLVVNYLSGETPRASRPLICKTVQNITSEMEEVQNLVQDTLDETHYLLQNLYTQSLPSPVFAIELAKSSHLCDTLQVNSEDKKEFIEDIKEFNSNIQILEVLESLRGQHHRSFSLSAPTRLEVLDELLEESRNLLTYCREQTKEEVQEFLTLLSLDQKSLFDQGHAENSMNEMKANSEKIEKINDYLFNWDESPFHSPEDYVYCHQDFSRFEKEIREITQNLKLKPQDEKTFRLLKQCRKTQIELQHKKRLNLECLQTCVRQRVQHFDRSCPNFPLISKREHAIHKLSQRSFLLFSSPKNKKKNASSNKDVQRILDCPSIQKSIGQFLEKQGLLMMTQDFGYKQSEADKVDPEFLLKLGLSKIDRELEEKLGHLPDPYERYCYWHEEDSESASEAEVQAFSDEIQRPIVTFRGDSRLYLEKIYNDSLPGVPLFLLHGDDKHFFLIQLENEE